MIWVHFKFSHTDTHPLGNLFMQNLPSPSGGGDGKNKSRRNKKATHCENLECTLMIFPTPVKYHLKYLHDVPNQQIYG